MAEPQQIHEPEESREGKNFEKLMASVGYLMYEWTLLDRAVLDQIRQLRMSDGVSSGSSGKARSSFSERLAEWQALVSQKTRRNAFAATLLSDLSSQAERLNRRRKLIVHHFSGASAGDAGGEMSIYYAEGGIATARASETMLTQRELSLLVEEVRGCRAGIEGLLELI